jgi:hypothetical protein
MGVFVLACVVVCALGADFGIIGLNKKAFKLLDILRSGEHRVACFDRDGPLGKSVIAKGGISAFSEESVFKFAPVVAVFAEDAHAFVAALPEAAKGREVVFFDVDATQHERLRGAAAGAGATAVFGEFFNDGDSAHLLQSTGAEALRAALRKSPANVEAVGDDSSAIHKRSFITCPWQAPGASLWTQQLDSRELGCADELSVCRLFVRLPAAEHRLHVLALYKVDNPIRTTDPQGFYQAFNGSVLPPSAEEAAAHPNGRCDSWLTVGAAEGPTCATLDPSFDRKAFQSGGLIARDTGFFCANPREPNASPATADKPPNTSDSILVAQLVTRPGFELKGQATIISSDERKQQTTIKQSFDCNCQ